MSKVLLISPHLSWERKPHKEMYPSGALLSLGTVLESKGHLVKCIHMSADGMQPNDLVRLLDGWRPDVVGITVMTFQAKTCKFLTTLLKLWNENVLVVVGGPHVSALGATFPDADCTVVGEGDNVILKIAEGKPGKLGCTLYPSRIEDLDSLPFWDFSLVNLRNYTGTYPKRFSPSFAIMTSRGCPFGCTFCSKSVFGNRLRRNSPRYVIDYLKYLATHWLVKEVFFQDDTFNVDKNWAMSVMEGILNSGMNKIGYKLCLRANEKLLDEEMLATMKKAGVWEVFIGVESGNQGMLDRMGKNLSIEEIERAFRLVRGAGIRTKASFIIGLPGETEQTIMDSVRLWKKIRPDWGDFSRAIPFPGTKLEQEVRENGHALCDCEDFILGKTLVRTDSLSGDELEAWARKISKVVLKDKLVSLLRSPSIMFSTIKHR